MQPDSEYRCYYCASRRQVVWTPAFKLYMCATCRQLVSAYYLNYNTFDQDRILNYLRLHGVAIRLTPIEEKEGEDIG